MTKLPTEKQMSLAIRIATRNVASSKPMTTSTPKPRWGVGDYVPANYKARAWYEESRQAIKLAYGDNWILFSALCALTSPNSTIKANLTLARKAYNQICDTGTITRTGFVKTHYNGIIKYLATGKLSGVKVNNFYQNLIGNEQAITIDIWMMRYAGFGDIMPSVKHRDIIETNIRRDASEAGITPAQRQAEIWAHVRGSGQSFGDLLAQQALVGMK
jgi:hypothetical protein